MRRIISACFPILLVAGICFLLMQWNENILGHVIRTQFMPIANATVAYLDWEWMVHKQMEQFSPLLETAYTQNAGDYHVVTFEQVQGTQDVKVPMQREMSLKTLTRPENALTTEGVQSFVPHKKKMELDRTCFADYEDLIKYFYTIDSGTKVDSNQLEINKLLDRDLTLSKSGGGPQILIYHTHSKEGFADSNQEDNATTIVGVGERLATVLREQYGYEVLHDTTAYDAKGREDAYANALPGIDKILQEHPGIQVVIDLHRDEVPEEQKLLMNLDGRPTARFMFFNGLSRTKKSGDIAYLKNENVDANLAFSFQMKYCCEAYYPGLTRKIYLKGYRYNMHLRPRTLLIELGAQNNTVEEAMNACDPLAHVLAMVLSGEYNTE